MDTQIIKAGDRWHIQVLAADGSVVQTSRGYTVKHGAAKAVRYLEIHGILPEAANPPKPPAAPKADSRRKLTDADVRAIRASTEKGVVLAARYGVSTGHISMVRNLKARRWPTD